MDSDSFATEDAAEGPPTQAASRLGRQRDPMESVAESINRAEGPGGHDGIESTAVEREASIRGKVEPLDGKTSRPHALFHGVELGYLTQIVLRVVLKRGADEGVPTSYRVQVRASVCTPHVRGTAERPPCAQ